MSLMLLLLRSQSKTISLQIRNVSSHIKYAARDHSNRLCQGELVQTNGISMRAGFFYAGKCLCYGQPAINHAEASRLILR